MHRNAFCTVAHCATQVHESVEANSDARVANESRRARSEKRGREGSLQHPGWQWPRNPEDNITPSLAWPVTYASSSSSFTRETLHLFSLLLTPFSARLRFRPLLPPFHLAPSVLLRHASWATHPEKVLRASCPWWKGLGFLSLGAVPASRACLPDSPRFHGDQGIVSATLDFL